VTSSKLKFLEYKCHKVFLIDSLQTKGNGIVHLALDQFIELDFVECLLYS
jgi:hypothetical protein